MSAWDVAEVKIGKGRGGGGGPCPVAVKTNAQINAAARMGNLTSAKKMGNLNASNQNNQLAYSIDNKDHEKIPEKKANQKQLEEHITCLMNAFGLNRNAIAQSVSTTVEKLWLPDASARHIPDWKAIGRLESKYQWKVNGTWGPKRKLRPDETELMEQHEKLKKIQPRVFNNKKTVPAVRK